MQEGSAAERDPRTSATRAVVTASRRGVRGVRVRRGGRGTAVGRSPVAGAAHGVARCTGPAIGAFHAAGADRPPYPRPCMRRNVE